MDYHIILITGSYATGINYPQLFIPIGPYRLRTELEAIGYKVKIIEHYQSLTSDELKSCLDNLVSKKTLWIGFSSTFFNPSEINLDLLQSIKNRYKIPIIVGGANAHKLIQHPENFIDILVGGYADNAVKAITEYYDKNTPINFDLINNKKWIDTNYKYYKKENVSMLPVIWKKEDCLPSNITIPIEIARGCIFKCAFCSYPLNGKKKFDYIREKKDLRNEFLRNYEDHGFTSYAFMDDTFNDSMYKMEAVHDVISSLPFKIKFDAYIKPELLSSWPDSINLLIEMGLRGSLFGVESFHAGARTKIGKGQAIEKSLEAVKILKEKSKGKVKTKFSLQVGLPGEPIKSILKTQEFLRSASYIDAWQWFPTGIEKPFQSGSLSLMSKNPEKYGYKIIQIQNDQSHYSWESDTMDFELAQRLKFKLTEEDRPFQKVAGWACGGIESLGISVDNHYKYHDGLVSKLPIIQMAKAKSTLILNHKNYNLSNYNG